MAAFDREISVVVLVDRDNLQKLIYYISRTLTDAETRRYFQGHPIHVLTIYRLQNVLSKPELSGRLAKWAIELGEYAIEYKPRPVIKGQVLTDFMAEVPTTREAKCQRDPPQHQREQVWQLYTDRAYNDKGSGAGLKLKDPDGLEFTYAIRLGFKSMNNEAEYEAFLAGLE
ncbi:uncharacterized protein LOC143563321 [Bidens hawaiensis]|uniref:uncharacterized protein LOC143563321 n=1 Tax=Bidens hawaiensis TaxID=980011 RepID=UPI00404AE820